MLIFAYFVPELGTFVRSLRFYFFKSISNKIKISEWITLFFTEALPAVGSAILIFIVLPELDVVKGAMLTNAVCFVPGLIGNGLFAENFSRKKLKLFFPKLS